MKKFLIIIVLLTLSLFASHSSGQKDVNQKQWENSNSKKELEQQLEYIVIASQKPIYHLRLDILEGAITPLLESNKIKALTITDNFSEVPFLIATRDEKEQLHISINKKQEKLDLEHLFLLEKEIIYEGIHIANIKMYIYKNRIDLNTEENKRVNLTKKEKEYLEDKQILKVCTIPNYLPYEKIDKSGKHLGILSDMVKIVEKQIEIDVKLEKTKSWPESLKKLENRQCDFIAGIIDTKERRTFANFTKTYLTEPLVIATTNEKVFINDITEMNNKKVGIIKGYAFYNTLKNKYPKIIFEQIDTPREALRKVSDDELYAFIDTLTSIVYHIQEEAFVDLKITGKIEEFIEITMGSRNDEELLNSILEKVVDTITEKQKDSIFKKWADIKIKQTIDFKYLTEVIIIFLLIFVFTQYWMTKLKNANKRLKDTTKRLEETNKKLKLLASTDSLTSLYNRGYFTKISNHIVSLAKREKTDTSLIILDIDNFKKINDTYGHQVGDKVIVSLSQILKKQLRNSDISCRFGGEEFIVLLPNTSASNAVKLAEKLRIKTQKQKVAYDETNSLNYTISLGVSYIDIENENSLENAIKRADECLYQAKKEGRNKVCASL